LTFLLWIIATISLTIDLIVRKNRDAMLAVGIIFVPSILGGIGYLYGTIIKYDDTIIKYDDIANAPLTKSMVEVSKSYPIIQISIVSGILLTLATAGVFLARRKRVIKYSLSR
jgi:hypothetical protein